MPPTVKFTVNALVVGPVRVNVYTSFVVPSSGTLAGETASVTDGRSSFVIVPVTGVVVPIV